jgi:hypothetical protein
MTENDLVVSANADGLSTIWRIKNCPADTTSNAKQPALKTTRV